MKCRNCNKEIIPFFSLGKLPLGNSLLTERERVCLRENIERRYELSVGFCPDCYLVQLTKTVSPKKLYKKTFYLLSAFKSIVKECRRRAYYLTKRLNLNSKSLVLEIGCNDGTQLEFFKEFGMKVLGIDPILINPTVARIASRKNIPIIADFFDQKLAEKLKKEQKLEADLILGIHLLNHIIKIKNFLKGVKLLLKPKGTAFFYFYMQRELDIITHEHIFYFSLLSLKNILNNVGLEIYDVEIKNGVLSLFISHSGVFPVSKKVKKFIKQEIQKKFNKLETYQKFAKNIIKSKKELVSLLKKLKDQGKKIVVYSASEKGNVLVNYYGIGRKYLDFVVDKSELKQGLYTPGNHLLIYPVEKIYQKKVDYLLILSWNISEEIIKQLKKYHNAGGKFIIPLPKIKII